MTGRPGPLGTLVALVVGGATAAVFGAAVPTAAVRTVPSPPNSVATGGDTPAPVAVRIPALAVGSALVALGVDGEGEFVPPGTAAVAGWFADGPAPGETGPAVVVGHVDSHTGPGVFAGLARLRPGDRIEIDRADGTVVAFAVHDVTQVPKAEFPTSQVYGPTTGPQLRLVTCGGAFDGDRYADNVIVRAGPVGPGGWTFRS